MLKIFALLFVMSCGTEKEYVPVQPPAPQQPPPAPPGPGQPPVGTKPSYGETQALLNNYCRPCHATAQFMGSEAALRNSDTLARVRSRNMPPRNASRQLPDAERTKILSFF